MRGWRRAFVLVLLSLVTTACIVGSEPAVRVLFVGNSYTAANDLPGMVRGLAGAVGRRVDTAVVAPGGWWWRDHASSSGTINAISTGDWDFVVLQEQSMAPADRDIARNVSYPAALQLTLAAVGNGADVLLFVTWGHRSGSPALGFSSYASMQIALAESYQAFEDALTADLAPVGMAWWMAIGERPDINLYQPDGSHPSVAGSYLAAAVITATVLDVDAGTLDRPLELDEATAAALRGFAERAVAGEVPWIR